MASGNALILTKRMADALASVGVGAGTVLYGVDRKPLDQPIAGASGIF